MKAFIPRFLLLLLVAARGTVVMGIVVESSAGGARHLLAGDSWMQMKEQCTDQIYKLMHRAEDNHISLLAIPIEEIVSDNKLAGVGFACPSVRFHDGTSGKESLLDSQDSEHEGLRLGLFSFSKIANAFDNAGESGPSHDIVKNNCATVVLNMLVELGINTRDIVEFTSQQLSKNRDTIHALRGSLYVNDILHRVGAGHANDVEDSVLLQLLVEHYVEDHANSATCSVSMLNTPEGVREGRSLQIQMTPSFQDSDEFRVSVHIKQGLSVLFEPVDAPLDEFHEDTLIFQPFLVIGHTAGAEDMVSGLASENYVQRNIAKVFFASDSPEWQTALEMAEDIYRFSNGLVPLTATYGEIRQATQANIGTWPGAYNVAFHNSYPRVLAVLEALRADLGLADFQEFVLRALVLDGRVPDLVADDPIALRVLFVGESDNDLETMTSFPRGVGTGFQTQPIRRLGIKRSNASPRRFSRHAQESFDTDETKKAVLVVAVMKATLTSYTGRFAVVQSLQDKYNARDYDARCGNGRIDLGEECDAGPANGAVGSQCDQYCSFDNPWYCGDGFTASDYDKYACTATDVNNRLPPFLDNGGFFFLPPEEQGQWWPVYISANNYLCFTAGDGQWEVDPVNLPNECWYRPFYVRGYIDGNAYKPLSEFRSPLDLGVTVEADGCDVECAKSKCLAAGLFFKGKVGELDDGRPVYGCQFSPCGFDYSIDSSEGDSSEGSQYVCRGTLAGSRYCESNSCMELGCTHTLDGTFSIQENANGINTFICKLDLLLTRIPDGYFCPPNFAPTPFERFSCSVINSAACDHTCANNYCNFMIEEGPIGTRSLLENSDAPSDVRELIPLDCDAGFAYNATIHHCEEINECLSSDEFPCSSDDGSYCVDHDPEVRFECGCAKGFLPSGYPESTTSVEYNGNVVDALTEVIESETGKIFNYSVPVTFRPLGCEAVDSMVPSGSPTNHDEKETESINPAATADEFPGHCGSFGRMCDLAKETCKNVTKADGTEVKACPCNIGFEKALNDPPYSLRGCVPVDKCARSEWNWCGPNAYCNDDSPGTPAAVRCTCVEGYVGGGGDCRATLSPSTAPVTSAPVTPSPVDSEPVDPEPGPAPSPPSRPRYYRRPGDTKYDPTLRTCTFTPCPFARQWVYSSTSADSVVTCTMLPHPINVDELPYYFDDFFIECQRSGGNLVFPNLDESLISPFPWHDLNILCERYFEKSVDTDST